MLDNAAPTNNGALTYADMRAFIAQVDTGYRPRRAFIVHPVYPNAAYLGRHFPTLAGYWPFAGLIHQMGLFG